MASTRTRRTSPRSTDPTPPPAPSQQPRKADTVRTTGHPARVRTKLSNPAALSFSAAHIAAEAYAIYQQRGGTHGHDLDDWLAAERRLIARVQLARATE